MSSETARVAIVTGAAQGIGLSIALQLADDGLDVAVNDIATKTELLNDLVKQIEAKGRRALAIPGDVSKEEDVQQMVAKTVEVLGGLDVMVANAGIAAGGTVVSTPLEMFDRVVAINIRGTMLCYKYAAEQMIKQGRGGRILGASSSAGARGTPGLSAYSTSKFAIRGLTQSAAQELAPHGITVNCYAPGAIITPMTSGPAATADHDGSWFVKNVLRLPPDTPVGKPEVVSSAVSYLIKPEAHFITGQTICMSGGLVMV